MHYSDVKSHEDMSDCLYVINKRKHEYVVYLCILFNKLVFIEIKNPNPCCYDVHRDGLELSIMKSISTMIHVQLD